MWETPTTDDLCTPLMHRLHLCNGKPQTLSWSKKMLLLPCEADLWESAASHFSFPFWAILVCGNWNSSSFSTNVPHYWSLRVCPMPCSHVFFGESFVLKSPSLLNLGSVVLACDLQCQCTFRFVVPDMGSSRVTSVSSYFCSRLVTLWILQWKALVKFMPPHPVKSSVRKHSNTFNVPQVFEFAHF